MTWLDVLRVTIAGLAALVSGAIFVVLVTYARESRRRRGSLLVRHVVEVSAGTLGIVATAGAGVYDQLPEVEVVFPGPDQRLWLYLGSMLLLLVAMLDVGRHTRRRGAAGRSTR